MNFKLSLKETNFLLQSTKYLCNFHIWKISTLLIRTNNLLDSICLIYVNKVFAFIKYI